MACGHGANVPSGVAIVAMGLQNNDEVMVVNMARKNYEENDEKCMITLDRPLSHPGPLQELEPNKMEEMN